MPPKSSQMTPLGAQGAAWRSHGAQNMSPCAFGRHIGAQKVTKIRKTAPSMIPKWLQHLYINELFFVWSREPLGNLAEQNGYRQTVTDVARYLQDLETYFINKNSLSSSRRRSDHRARLRPRRRRSDDLAHSITKGYETFFPLYMLLGYTNTAPHITTSTTQNANAPPLARWRYARSALDNNCD